MAKNYVTKTIDINVAAREIDFVSRFGENWQGLMDVMGITRPIRKAPGTALKAKIATVALENSVNEGEEIPYSKATIVEKNLGEITMEKYAKGVTLESINEYGYDVAIAKSDSAFRSELQKKATNKFYSFLATGLLTSRQPGFKSALAMAKGYALEKFRSLNLEATDVVGFVNILDFYTYLGNDASLTVNNEFGLNYIKNFMGYSTIFLCSDNEIARGTVIATPVENVVLYYVDPADSEFARAGLEYRTDGVTNLIGFHTNGNYSTAVSESFAIMGLVLFAEYLNGIAVVKISAATDFDALTATSAAATTTSGATKITITSDMPADVTYYFKADATAAPTIAYKAEVDSTWTKLELVNGVADNLKPTGLASADKATVVGVNGSGQAVYKATIASVTVKA